jgi:hypothetical protein
MPRVFFTPHLERFLSVPPAEVRGTTVREALDAVFADNPRLRGYILDDQGRLRQHVVVFVDGSQVADREGLSDTVAPGAEIYVMQALSGGSGAAAPRRDARESRGGRSAEGCSSLPRPNERRRCS